MPIKSPPHRHTVQQLDDGIQVVLPSKKKTLWVIWTGAYLLMWSYITGLIGYVLFLSLRIIGINLVRNHSAEFGDYMPILLSSLFITLFLLIFLVMGIPAIYSFLWHVTGKEIVKATPRVMTISRQIFGWKKAGEYLSASMNNLRVMSPRQTFFIPFKNLRNNPQKNGVIAFDYETKTHRFGLEIEEDEAKQVISLIQQYLSQAKAG